MKKYTTPAVLLLSTIGLASPAAAQNKEHLQMEAELRMLQEQNQQLSLAFQQAMEAIKALNGRFDAAMEAMRKGFADQALSTKNMAGDVSAIAERGRDTETKLRTLGDEITALTTTMTTLANSIAQTANATTSTAPADPNAPPLAAAPGVPPGPPPPVTVPSTLGMSPTRLLQQAKSDYDQGQYQNAITGFQNLIASLPETEAAIEAQYWIGESQYNLNRFPEAVAAFNLALQKGGTRFMYAPDALYRRGLAQERLGDLAGARASYDQAIKQFPQSPMATLAQQRLNRMTPPAGQPSGSTPARP